MRHELDLADLEYLAIRLFLFLCKNTNVFQFASKRPVDYREDEHKVITAICSEATNPNSKMFQSFRTKPAFPRLQRAPQRDASGSC